MADNKTTEINTAEQKKLQELLTNMDTTIYRLNILCNRFEKDKDMILKEGVDVKSAVKSLQDEIATFAKMRGEIGETLANKIKQASETIAREANDGIKQALGTTVEHTIQQLDTTIKKANDKFEYFYDLDKKRIIWMILGLIVLPVATGVLVAKIFMADPFMKFNSATCEVYRRQCVYVK